MKKIALTLIIFSIVGFLKAQEFNRSAVLNLVEALSHDSLQGRFIGTIASLKAQKIISDNYKKFNLKNFSKYKSFQHRFKWKNYEGINLIGYFEGKKWPQKYIAISAHYDHIGIKNGMIYNGADDNASGVGGLVALMDYFSNNPPDHSIVFAAFDGEEVDLTGSQAFVKDLPVAKEAILLNVNLDMISRSDKKELYVCGTGSYPFLKKCLDQVSSGSVNFKLGHDGFTKTNKTEDWTFSSDHGSFHAENIPFLYFGVEDHEDYHKSTDDFQKIDKEFYISVIQLIIRSVDVLDKKLSVDQ